jgi:hypothetical protein
MKHGVIFFSAALVIGLFAAPVVAWADANPDFDDDAKPILKMQPGLLQYVESRFEVKDTGTAKYPGDDDRRPTPPYIFRARPLGSSGPYNLRLLIQPGTPGHILGVVDMTKVHLTSPGSPSQPAVAQRPAPQYAPSQPPQEPAVSQAPSPQNPAASTPAPASPAGQQPSEPTADTPSGPIMDSSSPSGSSANPPSLAPPPDPAPANQ